MALETVVNIADLNPLNPTSIDPKSQGDDHIRNIKAALVHDFAGFLGAVMVAGTDGGGGGAYTLSCASPLLAYGGKMIAVMMPIFSNVGACTLNIDGIGAVPLRQVHGAELVMGDIISGRPYLAFYSGTEFRLLSLTKNYVDQLAFNAALPNQAGNAGKKLATNGTSAFWQEDYDTPTVTVFTASGTWTSGPNQTRAKVTVVGGGASGATSNTDVAGGAAGAQAVKWLTVTPSTTYNITVGLGGAAVTTAVTAGNAGGTSSFSGTGVITITATGGPGNTTSGATGVNGGVATGGDLNYTGGAGFSAGGGVSGAGGASMQSGSAAPFTAGLNFGGGAGGSARTAASGFAGAPGVVIIES